MVKHLEAGKLAETLALNYLERQGFIMLAKNWQCHYGEIDLIMTDNKIICFIEVRYRQHQKWGTPEETINYSKQKKIIKTAQLFLQQNQSFAVKPCQFDVIAITGHLDSPQINWLSNAFSVT